MQAAVILANVSRIFGTFTAVRNLSLSVPAGGATVILGENGAGKSTLLRLLAGLTAPTQGTIQVLGHEPGQQPGRVAYMSHAPMLYDELTGLENLRYFASLSMQSDGCRFHCDGSPEMALRAVGLDPALSRPVSQYSQGMRQRASLARVLQSDPDLLLLDEPFSNLDVGSAQGMVQLLADFLTWPSKWPAGETAARRTILLTTHQYALAEPLADVTLTMRAGTVVASRVRGAAA